MSEEIEEVTTVEETVVDQEPVAAVEPVADYTQDFDKMYNAIETMAKSFDTRLEKLASMVIDAGAVVKTDTVKSEVVEDTTRLEDLDYRI